MEAIALRIFENTASLFIAALLMLLFLSMWGRNKKCGCNKGGSQPQQLPVSTIAAYDPTAMFTIN